MVGNRGKQKKRFKERFVLGSESPRLIFRERFVLWIIVGVMLRSEAIILHGEELEKSTTSMYVWNLKVIAARKFLNFFR